MATSDRTTENSAPSAKTAAVDELGRAILAMMPKLGAVQREGCDDPDLLSVLHAFGQQISEAAVALEAGAAIERATRCNLHFRPL